MTLLLMSGAASAALADDRKPPEAPAANQAEFRLGPEDAIEVFVWKEGSRATAWLMEPFSSNV